MNKIVVRGTTILIVLSLVTAVMNGIQPMLIKSIIDLLNRGDFTNTKITLLYFLLTILVVLTTEFIGKYYRSVYKRDLLKLFRMGVVTSILEMKQTDFYHVEPNEYTSLLNNEIPVVVEESYLLLPNIVFRAFSILVYTGLLLTINAWLAWIIVVMNVIALMMPKLFKADLQKYKERSLSGLRKYNLVISDLISGFRTIKSFAYERDFLKQFKDHSNYQLKDQRTYEMKKAIADIAIGIVLFSTNLLILFVGVTLIQEKSITVGGLVAVLQISELIIGPIIGLTSDLNVFSSTRNIKKDIVSKYTIFGRDKNSTLFKNWVDQRVEVKTIAYEDVSFSYNASDLLLDHFNYTFEKGKNYLIIGPNGTGKSTLMKLLMNEFDLNEGDIRINDVKSIQNTYAVDCLNIGYASQMPYIFNGTLEENILLSRSFDEARYKAVLEIAAIDEAFMASRPEVMSDKLNALSGGERQKISVARTLYSNPDVVIFDEATSQMDDQSSKWVERQLLENQDLLFINIAHHLNDELLGLYDHILDFGSMERNFQTPQKLSYQCPSKAVQ